MELKTKLRIVVVLLALAVMGAIAYYYIEEKNTPSNKVMELSEYYDVAEKAAMVIIDGVVYDKDALMEGEHPYLDMDTVTSMFNHRFYWDDSQKLLILTTPDKVIKIKPDETKYTVNKAAKENEYPIAKLVEKTVYISLEFLAGYADFSYNIFLQPNRVLIEYEWGDYLYADVVKDTQIRVSQDIKSDLLKQLKPGEKLMVIDGGGIQENGFIKMMSSDGVRGYVMKSDLTETYYDTTVSSYKPEEYESILLKDTIYMGWQLLYTADNLESLEKAAKRAECLNVISPTWFYLAGTDGEMESYANHEYVARAHELGIDVWALYKNDTIEKVFKGSEDSFTILSNSTKRQKLIDSIIASADEYGIDGINIDFELLTTATGPHFIQFLRELSVVTHEKGYILSVDNYVPAAYNAYYDIASQSEIVDYIIIMGYDEHYSGSEEAGSVSSIGFFGDAIKNTLAMVPEEKIIMGIPFYTRLWKEVTKDDKTTVTVEATPNMPGAMEQVAAFGVTPEWDDKTAQYYAEYTKGDALYRIWIEDEESLAAKTKLIHDAELAGVAAWKLGDENPETWENIRKIMD